MQSNKPNDPSEIPRLLTENLSRNVCVCYDVPKQEIIEAFKNGAHTFEEISNQTYACQGSGCCQHQIERLIEVLTEVEAAESEQLNTDPAE